MRLRKHQGGTSIGPHSWENDGDVTEVPDELGRELLRIPDSGFEQVGEDDEPEENAEFTEVVEVGFVLDGDAPSTPNDRGEFPDRRGDRTAYRVGEDGESETVPPAPASSGEHPRVEEPGENRAGVKDVDRAELPDGERVGEDGRVERDGEDAEAEGGERDGGLGFGLNTDDRRDETEAGAKPERDAEPKRRGGRKRAGE
jgi:hypothetical protein